MRKALTVFALALSSFIGPFGGQMIIPVLTEAADFFGVPDVWMGLAITLYMIPFAIFQLISALFSYRFGQKNVMVGGTLLYSISSLILYFQTSFLMFIFLRVIQGLGSGLMVPVSMAYIGRKFEPEVRGRVFGVLATSIALGGIAGSLLGGFSGGIDWRLIFIFMAVSGFITVASLQLFLVDKEKNDKRTFRASLYRYKYVLSNWLIIVVGFSGAVIFFTRFSLNTYVSITVKRAPYLMAPEVLGGILSLAGWGGMISGPISGYMTDRFGRKFTIMFGFSAMLALNSIFLTRIWFNALAPLYFLFGFFSSMAFTGLNTLIVEVEKEFRDESTSIYGAMRFTGYALGPAAPIGIYNLYGLGGVAILNVFVILITLILWIATKTGSNI